MGYHVTRVSPRPCSILEWYIGEQKRRYASSNRPPLEPRRLPSAAVLARSWSHDGQVTAGQSFSARMWMCLGKRLRRKKRQVLYAVDPDGPHLPSRLHQSDVEDDEQGANATTSSLVLPNARPQVFFNLVDIRGHAIAH